MLSIVELATLLIGAAGMRRRWWLVAAIGVAWTVLGVIILADASDGVTAVTTATFGYLMVIQGLGYTAVTIGTAIGGGSLLLFRGLAILVFGLLIVDMPWHNDIANSLLFGLAFLVDGAVRIAAATVLHHARWRIVVLEGLIEIGLGFLALFNWPVSYHKTVPFTIGIVMVWSGAPVARLGWMMRRLRSPTAVFDLPIFSRRGWHFRESLQEGVGAPTEAPAQQQPLTVHVWTSVSPAEPVRRQLLVDRYIAAVDHKGMIHTGHCALEVAPYIYVSHYPAADLDHSATEIIETLRATADNNVPGRFKPSYAVEAAEWRQADAHVPFHRFDAARLRTFWEAYRKDDTYNLTNRNCSITVAVALDAALEGVLDAPLWQVRFLRLICNPDLWLAALIRGRAEATTWTPGLLLEYAQALRRVTAPAGASWLTRFGEAARRYRASRAPAKHVGTS